MAMDLLAHARPALAWRFLNTWLERTGEYEALPGLRLCLVYRALVRAKVAHLRAAQVSTAAADRQAAVQARDRYLDLAERWTAPRQTALILTHGVSGSGKSWLSAQLCGAIGAIRLRTDVERKRLFGLWGDPAPILFSGDPYRRDVSNHLFGEHLPKLARAAVAGGFPVLIDATFLRRADRQPMETLAEALGVPRLIVVCSCSAALSHSRSLN